MEYSKMKKDELIAECNKRNIDSKGISSVLINRLEEYDRGMVKPIVKEKKKKKFNPMLHRFV